MRGPGGTRNIVLLLDQIISSKARMPVTGFSLAQPESIAGYLRITRATYNPRRHTITLSLARRPRLVGPMDLTVGASGIFNAFGMPLDGNADGTGGDDYHGVVNLR